MRSLTPEQEQYLHQLKIEEMKEKLSNSEKGNTESNVQKLEDTLGNSKSRDDIKEENDSPNTKVLDDESKEKERRERLEAVADAKINLEQMKAEFKRVKNRVKGSKKKKGKKLKKKDRDTEEMIGLERELERMAKQVKDIEADSSSDEGESDRRKHKKKKKSKSKEKIIPDDKINIEVDAKLGQKILSMFVSGDMLQDVLKKEAKNTETAIQSIKKALEKKQYKDEKRKKKKEKKAKIGRNQIMMTER